MAKANDESGTTGRPMMRMRRMEIERILYPDNGKYKGRIVFEGERGEVQLNVDDAQCRRLFDVVAEGIVEVAKETAQELTAEAMASRAPEARKIA